MGAGHLGIATQGWFGVDAGILGSEEGVYVFHVGYWGSHIGFYGGVNYGFGYDGIDYEGGYWKNGKFFYNSAVNNITNVAVTNIYSKPVVIEHRSNASFNGGKGGTTAKATPAQVAAEWENHIAATPEQKRMRTRPQRTRYFRCRKIMATPRLRRRHASDRSEAQE